MKNDSKSLKVLQALLADYESRRNKLELDIEIALSDPRSIPDHFSFTQDLGAILEEAERLDSLANYTKTLIERYE